MFFACAGLGCVYHLEECTVFGNVKSSPQWSGVVQTHTVLLDGPEIPLGAHRGESEEFKCFNMLGGSKRCGILESACNVNSCALGVFVFIS